MDEYLEQALRLTTNYISARSVALILRDRIGNTGTGSSTCIRVGSHHLLATAGHVIEDLNDARIELIPDGLIGASPLPFVSRSCYPARPAPRTDVAWIELDPALTRQLRFLELADLLPGQQLDRERPFVVHGYPYDTAVVTADTVDVESTAALTMMAESGELSRTLRNHEMALEWPPRDENGRPMQGVPRPKGVSGGGTWHHPRHDEHAVFSPERLRLVGINLSWDKPSSILFTARIEYWLDLVAADFPDIRDAISSFIGSSGGAEGKETSL
jgi:hypothetical protein